MQPTTSQEYLVRLNKSLIYHFFLCNNKSLHYNIYNNNNVLLSNNELLSDIINFSVTVDKYEKIHLICITSMGELQYYINKNNNWSYKTISGFDIKSNIYKYLTLHISDKYTHILYIKTNLLTQDLSTIEHIYWNGKNINKIIVTNYIHDKYTSPLQISPDGLENLHIVYKVFYKDNHQLYYNKFNVLTKIWTTDELITDLQKEHSHPYIFIDKKQNLNLVWCTIEQGNFILKYKKKHDITNIESEWSSTQTLSNRDSNCLSPILIQESNNLKIYCKQNDKIIEIISKDFGDSWTNSANSKPYIIEEPKIIRYSSNPQIDDKYLAKHVYGNIKDIIQIIGINLSNKKEQDKLSSIQSALDQKQQLVLDQNQQPALDQKQNSLTSVNEKADIKAPLDKDIINLIKDMDNKINTILSQIAECKPKNHLADKSTQREVNYTTCEIKQNNNGIIDLDKLNNATDESEEPNSIMNELLSNYNVLEKQLLEIKEKKQELTRSINDYEVDLDLLEERIVGYKKQMLIFQEKLSDIASNNSIFQRFINFFK